MRFISMVAIGKFLSTPSARRATVGHNADVVVDQDFYPRPPRGGRHNNTPFCSGMSSISIHALREEGDYLVAWHRIAMPYFYPRPPRGGRLVGE